MTVATIYQNPHTPEDFAAWSFAHAAHHRDIQRVIFELSGTRLDEFVLDPFDPQDAEGWLLTHQMAHQQMDEVLGIGQSVLSSVQWDDPVELAAWLRRHGNEHFQAGQILNV